MEDYVVVLGSGLSINNLTDQERKLLDSCKVKIAINKFAAFYNKAGIVPTHIYYTDDYYESSRNFFEYMVQYLRKDKLANLTFIVSKRMFPMLAQTRFQYILKKIREKKIHLSEVWDIYFSKAKKNTNKDLLLERINILQLPPKSKLQIVEIRSYIDKGTAWAKSLKEPLYHFKGSLSTVLNYISIFYPNKKVLLVGVDFNTADYFFEKELNNLNFNTKDWTYNLRKKENKHYSIIMTDGVKMDDEIPFMIEQLYKRNIQLFSVNKDSYLVKEGFVCHVDLE